MAALAVPALAQTPPSPAVPSASVPAAPAVSPPTAASPTANPPDARADLDAFRWIAGCWQGAVAGREFREDWMPPRGGMMLGVSQTVQKDKTIDFEYLRIEVRTDGPYYVVSEPGKKEIAFRYVGASDVQGRMTYAFENPAEVFPRRVAYARGDEGWLYAAVEGRIEDKPKSVVYPMRKIDCGSGEFVIK